MGTGRTRPVALLAGYPAHLGAHNKLRSASFAIGTGSVLTGSLGDRQKTNADAQAQAASEGGFADHVNLENTRLNEQGAANSDELTKVAIERRKAGATARGAAGEAGVSELSLDALLREYGRSEAQYRDIARHKQAFDDRDRCLS